MSNDWDVESLIKEEAAKKPVAYKSLNRMSALSCEQLCGLPSSRA